MGLMIVTPSMLDLKIDSLNLNIENGAGQEHRIQPIALSAVTILADRLSEREAAGIRSGGVTVEDLNAAPVSLDLNKVSNHQAAEQIANAWLEALALRLKL